MQYRVATVEELRRDRVRVVDVDGRRIGVVSVGDRFYAMNDRCPHMGASMCHGTVSGTFLAAAPHELVYGKHDEVIRCPWHGWEFDLQTGRSLLEPDRVGLKTYEVTVENGEVILHR